MLAPMIVRRIRPGFVIGLSLALAATGFALLTQASGASGLAVVVAGLVLAFVGLMPVSALGVDIVLGAAPPERAGAASAISETTQELGGALGIAILGSIGTAVYRGQMIDVATEGVSSQAAEAAGDTLGGATGVAEQLPAALLATAAEAFTNGLPAAAVITVGHLPPGTSKWNKIEHRMFSPITMNWRGPTPGDPRDRRRDHRGDHHQDRADDPGNPRHQRLPEGDQDHRQGDEGPSRPATCNDTSSTAPGTTP